MADGKSCTAVRIYLVPQNCTVKYDQDAAVVHSVVSDSSAAPWTVALQAPLSMGFLRWEHWRGAPFPPPGDLPHSGSNLHLRHWQVGSSSLSLQESPTGKKCLFTLRAFYHNKKFLNGMYYSNKVYILWDTVRIIKIYHNDMNMAKES